MEKNKLEVCGLKGFWSGRSNSCTEMMSRNITIMKGNRFHIYTTSQLMELFF